MVLRVWQIHLITLLNNEALKQVDVIEEFKAFALNDVAQIEDTQTVDSNTITYSLVFKDGLKSEVSQENLKNGDKKLHFTEGKLENTVIFKNDGSILLDGGKVSATTVNDNDTLSGGVITPNALSSTYYSDTSYYGSSSDYERERDGSVSKYRVDFDEPIVDITQGAFLSIIAAVIPGGAVVSGLVQLASLIEYCEAIKSVEDRINPEGEAIYMKVTTCDLKNPPDVSQGNLYFKVYTRAYYDSRYRDPVVDDYSIMYKKVSIRMDV